jgi:hypothetical protein
MYKHKNLIITVGAERSGKTFFSEKMAKIANESGKTIIAYNKGMDKDFADFITVDIPDLEDTREYIYTKLGKDAFKKFNRNPSIRYFQYNGMYHDFRRFNAILGGKKIAIYQQDMEDSLFKNLFKYASNCMLIGDDFRGVTRNGLSRNLITLLSRKNHTGRQSTSKVPPGMDINLIYHNCDLVNAEFFSYTTHIVLYFTQNKPKLARIENEEIKQVIWKCYELLKEGKKNKGESFFDAYQINLRGKNSYTYQLIEGSKINKL